MKLSRRLIPAFAMLLVSAVLMSTASFAWFSMNSEVTATGMTVNAQADTSLVIAGVDDGNVFASKGTTTVNATGLMPCTSANGIDFGKLADGVKVESAASSAATWGQGAKFTDVLSTEKTTYVASAVYTLKNIDANPDNADASVYVKSITVDSSSLSKAVRVAIQLGNGTVYVYNAGGGANTESKVGVKTNGAWDLGTVTYEPLYKTTSNSLGTLDDNAEVTLTVWVWFEGQDTTCYSDNVPTDGMGIDIVLTTIASTVAP